MKLKKYIVLVVDRKQAILYSLIGNSVEKIEFVKDGHVPQSVKHGDDTWDAQNKIDRHIDDHLHRHLTLIAKKTAIFISKSRFDGLLIAGRKNLFTKMYKHLSPGLQKKVRGTFVTELKIPSNDILHRALAKIEQLDKSSVDYQKINL